MILHECSSLVECYPTDKKSWSGPNLVSSKVARSQSGLIKSGTSLIQMLLSNFAKFVQVQLRVRNLDGVQGNHEIVVEQFTSLDSNVALFLRHDYLRLDV